MAFFSSRGSSILKPDVIASSGRVDRRARVHGFSSMACPHVSVVVAMVRQARPTWSPAAIKPALMTTAYKQASARKESTPFARGAGHVDPNRALAPGLVYDAGTRTYIAFLCSLWVHRAHRADRPLHERQDCSAPSRTLHRMRDVTDANYPAFSVVFESYNDKQVMQRRLVARLRRRSSAALFATCPSNLL